MSKLLGVLVALVIFGALPAIAAAQTPPSEGDTVSSGNTQDADIEQEAEAGQGGEAAHEAGGDFRGHGGGRVHGDSGGVGGGGGGVGGVTLARTGFDSWILAVLGGLSLAGGIGLLAAQRRGRPHA
jgi:hypothetical protein